MCSTTCGYHGWCWSIFMTAVAIILVSVSQQQQQQQQYQFCEAFHPPTTRNTPTKGIRVIHQNNIFHPNRVVQVSVPPPPTTTAPRRRHARVSSLQRLYGIPLPQLYEFTTSTTNEPNSAPLIEYFYTALRSVLSAWISYGALVAYYDRPRGTLHPDIHDMVIVQPSLILPNGGLGVYCRNHTSIPKGTILGTYPGVLLPIVPNTNTFAKVRQYPHCETYIWRFSDNQYIIDPTNPLGLLPGGVNNNNNNKNEPNENENDSYCYGGNPNMLGSIYLHQSIIPSIMKFFASTANNNNNNNDDDDDAPQNSDRAGGTVRRHHPNSWFRKSTLLCRINEPPKGYDVNVITIEHVHNRSVSFVTERTILEQEELFIDYGLNYDRSNYR